MWCVYVCSYHEILDPALDMILISPPLHEFFFPTVPPSQPQGVAAISTGPTWSWLSLEEPSHPGLPASSTRLYVAVATPRGSQRGTRESLPTADLFANVTGLLPNLEYEVTVLAQNVQDSVTANSTPSALATATTTTTGNYLAPPHT